MILLCEGPGCLVAVHQHCYGVSKVPKGKWVCDGCAAKLDPNGSHCAVCPVNGGALRKVSRLGRVLSAQPAAARFIHLACALWIPEIEINDPEQMKDVSLENLTAVRTQLNCSLCKQAGGGVVQCSYGSCCRSFHVLCGRHAGHVVTFRNNGDPVAFCATHSSKNFMRMREALLEGKEIASQGETREDSEGPLAEPAEQVDYERQREENVKRIEAAKKAIFRK